MNREVYDAYKKLNEMERSEFAYTFKNSPTATRFITFLEKQKSPVFRSAAAIEQIYAGEKDQTAYAVLENRFFKLRKKILDALQGSNRITTASQLHTEEELDFFKAKQLIAEGNKEAGYRQLVALEKTCWEKNIFELLPAVIDQLLFCNQSFNRLESNTPLYERQEQAITLQADMNRCCMTARKIYEINFRQGITYAQKELAFMRSLAAKHRHFPRFLLCYHHISAYYKLGSRDYIAETQVISRHLSAFKKLQSKFPFIPLLTYKVNYAQLQHMHFNSMIMSYHFHRCEFEETYRIMQDVAKQMDDPASVFKTHKTESFYYNLITAQCMTHRYREALDAAGDFAAYLKTNQQLDKLVFTNVLKARIYSETYPQTFKMDPVFLLEQTEEQIKILRKTNNVMISLDQVLVLRIKLWIIAGDLRKAAQGLKEDVVKNYLEELNLYAAFLQLINILSGSGEKTGKLKELEKQLLALKHRANLPAQYMHVYWLMHYVSYLVR